MDDYSGKSGGNGILVSRKESSLILKDASNNRDRNPRLCNRIGCYGSVHSPKINHVGCPQKTKSSRLSFRPISSGKEIVGSSSKSISAGSSRRSTLPVSLKKLSSQIDTDSSEASSTLGESVPEPLPSTGEIHPELQPESSDAGTSTIAVAEVRSSSVGTSARTRGTLEQKLGKLDASSSSKGLRAGTTSRYNLRELRCNSASDVVRSGCSSSDSNRRKDVVKKRICEGESSSLSKGKKISGVSLEGRSIKTSTSRTVADSRRSGSGLQQRDNNGPSIRTRGPVSSYARGRGVAALGSGNNLSRNDPQASSPQISRTDASANLIAPGSAHQFSVENSFPRTSPYIRPGSSNESSRGARPSSPVDIGHARALLNRDSFRRYNMEGIAEVLLALERIEQDAELTYEQLLVLETNFFLNGLNFYDQHREMRLDIDNMSYEELLALEERMGCVSTALSEEALSECLKTSIYHSTLKEEVTATIRDCKDDVKCSICQEEYADGDEVGRLPCDHQYHAVCVQKWLGLKNWCPICKASAATSSSPLQPAT